MNDYQNFPPSGYLLLLLKQFPDTALTYINIWKMKKGEQPIPIFKEDVRKTFLMSPTLLRNQLLDIVSMGLASIDETPNMLVIDLIPYDDDMEFTH